MKRMKQIIGMFSMIEPKFFGLSASAFNAAIHNASLSVSFVLIIIIPGWAYAASTSQFADETTEMGLVGIIVAILAQGIVKGKTATSAPFAVDEEEIIRRERVRRSIEIVDELKSDIEALKAIVLEQSAKIQGLDERK